MLIAPTLSCASSDSASAKSLLWKITSEEGEISHVFGTIHIADTMVFKQRDTVLQVLHASRTYASELHLDSVLIQMSPTALILPAGTLYDLFDTSYVRQICERLKEVNSMLGSACSRLKPGAIMMIMTMAAIERTAPSSIDEFLWARAKEQKLQRTGLESVAEQLSVMDSMPPAYVLDQLKDLDSLAEQVQEMRQLYAHEDLAGLHAYSMQESGMDRQTMEIVNDRRNVRMVQRMEPLLKTGGAFIAIGALHLTGPSSVLDLLKARGYRVEPVAGGKRIDWLDWDKTVNRR